MSVEQHHVGPGIDPAFPHHQVLFGELPDQRAITIHNSQTTDVVLTQ